MHALFKAIGRLAAWLRTLGPYVAIELLLPGGSVIALLVWLWRRHSNMGALAASARAAALISGSMGIPPHLSLPLHHGPILIYSAYINPQVVSKTVRTIQRRDLCAQHASQARQQ